MNLQAMTKEKLQFLLPVVFTVGPDVNARGANSSTAPGDDDQQQPRGPHAQEDRGDALMKYAMLLTDTSAKSESNTTQFLGNIVKGIIEGETRVLVSSMTMEEIFTEREEFSESIPPPICSLLSRRDQNRDPPQRHSNHKADDPAERRIFRNIQSELDQFGLKIYNANVKELRDAPESNYFESLARKAHEGATNQARIDVADAQLKGNVGEAKRRGEQEREIAKINAETAVQKTERDSERAAAEANLSTRRTAYGRDVAVAEIEARRATESRDEELKRDVEVKRAAAEMARLRADDVVRATIAREAKQQAADARAYEVSVEARADAEARAYRTQAEARAGLEAASQAADADAYRTRTAADAANYAALKDAEARLQAQLKEAEGTAALAGAYARMAQAFGGPAGLLQYMMIEKGTYVELAGANASAIRGLEPKISVWNTGAAQAGDGASPSGIDTMRSESREPSFPGGGPG